MRAIEVLERLANADARRLLATMATGAAGSPLTQQAQQSLRRLGGAMP